MKNQKEFQMVTLIVVGFLLVGIAPTKGLLSALWTGAAIFTVLWGVFLCVNFREIRGAVERSIALRRERRRNHPLLIEERRLFSILESRGWFFRKDRDNKWCHDNYLSMVNVHFLDRDGTQRIKKDLLTFILFESLKVIPPQGSVRPFILELQYRGRLGIPQYHLVGHPCWKIDPYDGGLRDLHGHYLPMTKNTGVLADHTKIVYKFQDDWWGRILLFVENYDSVAHYMSEHSRMWAIQELGATRRAFQSTQVKAVRLALIRSDPSLYEETLFPNLSPAPAKSE